MTSDAADTALAAELAAKAGRILLDVRGSGLEGEALGEAGDQAANRFLVDAIHTRRPEDGLLSEETPCDGSRLNCARVWIIDPLDGTREYREGRDDWAVHVALTEKGEARIGAVALPAVGLTFDSGKAPPLAPLNAPPRMLVSRSRPSPEALAVANAMSAEVVAMGSAGAKAMTVVRGAADIYLHTGGQHEWDSCAPVAVARAAGLHVSRADGTPLRYNCRDTYIRDILICRRELADEVLRLYAQLSGAPLGLHSHLSV